MNVLTIGGTHIRPALPTEHTALVMLWERSVRATHDFLTEADIVFYRPLVAEYFEGSATDIWVLADEANVPIGFLALTATRLRRCSWSRPTEGERVVGVWCRTRRACGAAH